MADKTTAKAEPKAKVTGATSGVLASGPAGKAARQAAKDAASHFDGAVPKWANPNFHPSDNDQSIDARMARLHQSRTKA
jgi:hypothetical protein